MCVQYVGTIVLATLISLIVMTVQSTRIDYPNRLYNGRLTKDCFIESAYCKAIDRRVCHITMW